MRGARQFIEALDAAGTSGLDVREVIAATGVQTKTEARALVAAAVIAERAYRPPNAHRVYSTAPF